MIKSYEGGAVSKNGVGVIPARNLNTEVKN